MKKFIIIILLLGVIFFGNKFRENNYATVPFPGDTADEYSFGWLGISLIRDRYPISWSGISGYKSHDYQKINVDKIFDIDFSRGPFPINKPWFDHPPLMGLVVGGYAYLKGVREFVDASVIILRRPMLKIVILVTILIFILGTQLFGKWVGLLASFLYTIIPTIVISSRLALAENGLIPIFLTSLILAHEYFKKKKRNFWVLATVVGSSAVLFKLSGVSVPLSLFLLALFFGEKEKWRLAVYPVVGALFALGLFAAYGAYYDWETFVNVLRSNSNRFFGASSEIFYTVFSNAKITRNYTDGWITASLISFFITTFSGWAKDKNIKFLSIAFFSYLFVFLFFGSESYGSYRFPFYPLTIISLAYVFYKLWEKPNILLAISLALLPLGTSVHRIVGVVGFQELVSYFRVGVLVSFAVFVVASFDKKKFSLVIQRVFMVALFVLMLYWTIREIYFVDVDKWYFVT